MSASPVTNGCRQPTLSAYLAPYCFGDLSEQQRFLFEQHVLECDTCWRELERLTDSVKILRTEESLKETLLTQEVAGIFGLSIRLEEPFAGHLGYVVTTSVLFSALLAVPFLVEIAYAFDQFGSTAMRLALAAFVFVIAVTMAGFWLDVKIVRSGGNSFRTALGVWLAGTVAVCVGAWTFLPSVATVDASFQTWPAHLGYLKSVFYAWLVGPIFMLLPFHFVTVMQREIRRDRQRQVMALLVGDASGVPPRGVYYPRVWALTSYVAGLFALNYFGVAHLFESLRPGEYRNLFMSLVLLRAAIWLLLPIVSVWWYAGNLSELKRECLLAQSFNPGSQPMQKHH